MITNKGKVLWANAIGDLRNGFTGTVNTVSSTTLKALGAVEWSANQFVGQDVYSGAVVGTVLSNTGTTLTVARWEKLPAAGELANNRAEEGGEPALGAAFSIVSGATPAAWVALSKSNAEPKAGDETLAEELPSGTEKGLGRGLAVFNYIGGKLYEVKLTFTAQAKDELKVPIYKIGIFNAQREGVLMFETLLESSFELTTVGDQVVVTDVVTGS